MNTRTISTCLTDAIKAMDVFAYIVRWMASVMNAAQGCAQAVLTHGEIAGERLMRCNIAECERHGCAQVQYGECHPSVLSPCCVRRIRPSRHIRPTRHRALLAKHHGLTDDKIAIVEGKNETNQEPQGKTVGRPSASLRKRRQVTTSAPSESTDDKVRELMNMEG